MSVATDTRAAARLGVSQSALSHALRKLEARLGIRLLTRTTRNVSTTEAGERLLETLRPSLENIDRQLALLSNLRDRPSGTIRITTPEHAAQTVLWPVIDRFLNDYPDVQIELNAENSLSRHRLSAYSSTHCATGHRAARRRAPTAETS